MPFSVIKANAIDDLAKMLDRSEFMGEVVVDGATRAAMSTDNSVYRILPDLILAPMDSDDLAAAMRLLALPRFSAIPVTARGGGTGTNGQSLNSGVIIDFRRHMNRLLAMDEQEGWVDVEPGMVLRDLNEQLAAKGLHFAPMTSSASRCTIGGMIGTDASGKGSRIYGKTSDNVLGLDVMLMGGERLSSISNDFLPHDLATALAAACDAGRASLLKTVPALSRRFTGYDLERARPDKNTLEWWRLYIGAESTLGLVTRARLKLKRKPAANCLVIVAFPDFESALKSVEKTLAFDPVAVETMDENTQARAREAGLLDKLPKEVQGARSRPGILNFVEFVGPDESHALNAAKQFAAATRSWPETVGLYLAANAAEISALWSIREKSVGLLGRSGGSRRPVSGIEDCVVPPARMPAFMAEFKALLKENGLGYGIFGHVDVGCMHVRPALDIDDKADREKLTSLSDAVFALVCKHGGIFWGEHGKGVRGQYLEKFVGPVAYRAFERIKLALDPQNRFNPGKLVSPKIPLYRVNDTPVRRAAIDKANAFANAFGCNGNAECLSADRNTPMCPSFKETSDLRHSPKGRAEALKYWHEIREENGDVEGLEKDVFASLDNCLGCKSCANSCPMQIDIPELKSRFLEVYHRKRARPISDRAAIAVDRYCSVFSRFSPLLSVLSGTGLIEFGARVIGLTDLPRFSIKSLSSLKLPVAKPGMRLDSKSVILVADPFSAMFDVDAVGSIADGLVALDYVPYLAPLRAGGKPAHVKGDRSLFRKIGTRFARDLRMLATAGAPLVATDPAFALMIRHDYPNSAIEDAPEVLLIDEYLCRRLASGDIWPTARQQDRISVFRHCMEQSSIGANSGNWNKVFGALGLDIDLHSTGCCGMAGLYGHEVRHADASKRLFEMSWRDKIAANGQNYVTGFSCRCQVRRMTNEDPAHPMSAIGHAVRGNLRVQ